MTALPAVTVIIPTAGRVALTRACIESIQEASVADGLAVRILVVDSSAILDQPQLRTICTQLGVDFVQGPRSVSQKRNLGADQAQTDNVMFVDSDCTIAPGCLAAHLDTLRNPAVHASQGTVLFRGPETIVFRAVRCSGILNAFKPRQGQPVRSAASGNLMVQRVPFLAVRFDPHLGPPALGGEDVDFGLRLSEQGFQMIGTPAAVAYHDTQTWNELWPSVRRFFSWGRSEAHLIERHPSIAYLDMPSPVLVMLLLGMCSVAAAWWSWMTLLALPLGFLVYAALMSVAGARRHPDDRLGGAMGHWVFFVLDLGRVWESARHARPFAAFSRLRFSEDQVTQEWQDIVPASWALWFMVLAGIVYFWWAIR
jgi:glycosyltransferase involved in cell wall biosynthesis